MSNSATSTGLPRNGRHGRGNEFRPQVGGEAQQGARLHQNEPYVPSLFWEEAANRGEDVTYPGNRLARSFVSFARLIADRLPLFLG